MGLEVEPATIDPPATQLMRRAFEAIAARDIDELAVSWDERTLVVLVALQLEVVGATDLRDFFEEMFTAVPDLDLVIEEIHGVDGTVAVGQWHLTGTFSGGPFQGIEPTGRRVDLRGIDVMRFEGRILRRNDIYYDGLTFARQIGLLPIAGSPADRGMRNTFNALTRARRRVRSRGSR
jgi:predicted ester cyclase